MPTSIRNVVIFGDSLSDIGTKWKTPTGKFALTAKMMTVSASGRFSDSRNWTDFMYEAATGGQSLVKAGAGDTITASKNHLRFTNNSLVPVPGYSPFSYANYAEGGACGGIPASKGPFLGTFKDQVKKFRSDYTSVIQPPGITLFFVWFGANDLFTAECKPEAMISLALKIADKRRDEVEAIVGKGNARFIFMNLGRPEAAVRYQEWEKKFTERSHDDNKVRAWWNQRKVDHIAALRRGADLFNTSMQKVVTANGDDLVDIASVISPDVVTPMLDSLHLLPGAQPELKHDGFLKQKFSQAPKQHIDPKVFDDPKLASKKFVQMNITTSDKVHPTDQVYKLAWAAIKETILRRGYKFGQL